VRKHPKIQSPSNSQIPVPVFAPSIQEQYEQQERQKASPVQNHPTSPQNKLFDGLLQPHTAPQKPILSTHHNHKQPTPIQPTPSITSSPIQTINLLDPPSISSPQKYTDLLGGPSLSNNKSSGNSSLFYNLTPEPSGNVGSNNLNLLSFDPPNSVHSPTNNKPNSDLHNILNTLQLSPNNNNNFALPFSPQLLGYSPMTQQQQQLQLQLQQQQLQQQQLQFQPNIYSGFGYGVQQQNLHDGSYDLLNKIQSKSQTENQIPIDTFQRPLFI